MEGYLDTEGELAFLVTTLDTEGKRPGIGNAGFFANTTCLGNPNFILVPNSLGNKQGTVIEKADFLYKHSTIIANRDFTGVDIKNIHESIPTEMRPDPDMYFIPLEWPYGKADNAANAFKCQCITHCINTTPSERPSIFMGNANTKIREPTGWDEGMINSSDVTERKKQYIQQFLKKFNEHRAEHTVAGPIVSAMAMDVGFTAQESTEPKQPEVPDNEKEEMSFDYTGDLQGGQTSVMGIAIRKPLH
jgi:hypothetical protein